MDAAGTLDELNRTRRLRIQAELHSRIKHGIERLQCRDLPDAGVPDRIPDLDIDEVVATLIHICADAVDLYTDRNGVR